MAPPIVYRLNRAELARVMRLIDQQPDGCWIWKGPTTPNGYAKFQVGPGKRERVVHRVLWEHVNNAPIPEGLQGGHTCHDAAVLAGTCEGGDTCPHRKCVNPEHQSLQTASENTMRQAHAERAKTHCPQGHPYDEENTRIRNGKRHCAACQRERDARRSAPQPA
jgi:hypothetical protein